jgi:hypothetical protein
MKITKRRSTTEDDLRARLRAVMERPIERRDKCGHCGGTGELVKTRAMSTVDVQRATGISNQTIGNFLKGSSMYFETGIQLLEWIEQQERAANPLEALDVDHQPRTPEFVEKRESPRLRQLRDVSLAAASKAAIDAKDRPLQLRGGR